MIINIILYLIVSMVYNYNWHNVTTCCGIFRYFLQLISIECIPRYKIRLIARKFQTSNFYFGYFFYF